MTYSYDARRDETSIRLTHQGSAWVLKEEQLLSTTCEASGVWRTHRFHLQYPSMFNHPQSTQPEHSQSHKCSHPLNGEQSRVMGGHSLDELLFTLFGTFVASVQHLP